MPFTNPLLTWINFNNYNGCTVGVWEWISNFIPHFIMDVITYPCLGWSQTMLVKVMGSIAGYQTATKHFAWSYDGFMAWTRCPHYWPFVMGIHPRITLWMTNDTDLLGLYANSLHEQAIAQTIESLAMSCKECSSPALNLTPLLYGVNQF